MKALGASSPQSRAWGQDSGDRKAVLGERGCKAEEPAGQLRHWAKGEGLSSLPRTRAVEANAGRGGGEARRGAGL